jgi:hypothetical protein
MLSGNHWFRFNYSKVISLLLFALVIPLLPILVNSAIAYETVIISGKVKYERFTGSETVYDTVTAGSVVLNSCQVTLPSGQIITGGDSATIDSNGYYSLELPAGCTGDLIVQSRAVASLGLTFSHFIEADHYTAPLASSTLDFAISQLVPYEITVKDTAGNPVNNFNAQAFTDATYPWPITNITFTGSSATPSDTTSRYDPSGSPMGCGSSTTNTCKIYVPSSTINDIAVTATLPGGVTMTSRQENVGAAISVPTAVDFEFQNILVIRAPGAGRGSLNMLTQAGTAITAVETSTVGAELFPDNFINLSGGLGYTLTGVTVGGLASITFTFDYDKLPNKVFKKVAGAWIDITSGVTLTSGKVILEIRDGGPYDADGTANGEIVDPISFLRQPTPPNQPSAPSVVSGNGQITVSWVAPAANDFAIDGYEVQVSNSLNGSYSSPSQGTCATTVTTGLNCVASGLTNGSTYFFKVAARNLDGLSPYSVASLAVSPVAPLAPTGGGVSGSQEPIASSGDSGDIAPKPIMINFQVVDPSDSKVIYTKPVCIEIYSQTFAQPLLAAGCSDLEGRVTVEVGNGKVSVRVFELGKNKEFKEYAGEVQIDTFKMEGGFYFLGTSRFVVTFPSLKIDSATPTPTPTPSATPTPTPTPSATPTPATLRSAYFLITTSTKLLTKISIKRSTTSLGIKQGKALQITIATVGQRSARVNFDVKDPSGKSYRVNSRLVLKNQPYLAPRVKFLKKGSYTVTIHVGAVKKRVTVKVSP